MKGFCLIVIRFCLRRECRINPAVTLLIFLLSEGCFIFKVYNMSQHGASNLHGKRALGRKNHKCHPRGSGLTHLYI